MLNTSFFLSVDFVEAVIRPTKLNFFSSVDGAGAAWNSVYELHYAARKAHFDVHFLTPVQ